MSKPSAAAPHRGLQILVGRLRGSRLGRRLKRWLRGTGDGVIPRGIGQGLRFNPASGNPDYALGTNEPPVQEALAEMLHPGDVFYDVGANVGFLTVIGARLVGPDGQVIAFEPVAENAAAVRHNCALNGFDHVRIREAAVSDEEGTAELQLAHFSGGAALATAATPPDFKDVITVPVTTIDGLIARQEAPQPMVVKIDVEGAEINVLRGMRETLRQVRPLILYELDDNDAKRLAEKARSCAAFLVEAGYEIRQLDDGYPNIDWLVAHYVATPKEKPD